MALISLKTPIVVVEPLLKSEMNTILTYLSAPDKVKVSNSVRIEIAVLLFLRA